MITKEQLQKINEFATSMRMDAETIINMFESRFGNQTIIADIIEFFNKNGFHISLKTFYKKMYGVYASEYKFSSKGNKWSIACDYMPHSVRSYYMITVKVKNGFHIYSTEVKVNQYGGIPTSSFDTIKEFINQHNK